MNAMHHRPGAPPASAALSCPASQNDVVSFLSSRQAHGGAPVRRIDTHISHIFLAGQRAYKMKRALALDFLDYTSLDERHRQCCNEIAANQAMAPDLYLGVIPVTRKLAGLQVGGDGEPVEWLVEMVRFDGETQFDRLVEANGLTPGMMQDLADTVAAAHCASPVRTDHGGFAQLEFFLGYVGKALAEFEPDGADSERIRAWRARFAQELDQHGAFLDARRRHGFVRRCHGDMHLANICLFEGRATPFDAIEFNDEIACCDVLYDLAFPLMDLIRFGRPDLSNTLFNRYLAGTRGYAGLGLLPLFLSMRAAIRAMAAVMGPPTADRADRVSDLVRLALGFLEDRQLPRLVAVGGLSGTGKSTIAAALATCISGGVGAVVLRSDVIRKRLLGLVPEAPADEHAYDRATDRQVYARLLKDARRTLRAGQTVIADATFIRSADRAGLAALAADTSVPFDGLWLEAEADLLRRRLAGRGPDASDATGAVMEAQARRDLGAIDWHRIDAGGTPGDTVSEAVACLKIAGGCGADRA